MGLAAPKADRWLTIGDVSTQYRVHPNTIRKASDRGALKCYRLNGLSHRRFKTSDVEEWLGVETEGPEAEKVSADGSLPVALVARVSGGAQARSRVEGSTASDLSRQVERIEEWIRENYGKRAKVSRYVRTASGLNLEHETLHRLLADILANKFSGGVVVVENKERLARWGFSLFETICQHHNTKLIVIADAEPKTEEQEWVQDLLSLTHVYSCKLYSKRSAERSRTVISDDILADLIKWSGEGVSIRQMVKNLEAANRHLDAKGRHIHQGAIRRVLKSQAKAIEAIRQTSSASAPMNSFHAFWRAKVRKASEGTKLKRKSLVAKYQEWCKANGQTAVSDKAIGSFLRSHFPNVVQKARKTTSGETIYLGLSLLNL